jgi:Ca2+:H+ antiporter
VRESLIALATFSWLNIFFIFTPLAWVGHFVPKFGQEEIPSWSHSLTFTFAFLSIVAHENFFDFLGEQMAFYLGKALGDLLTVTLNNAVEATLAILLLAKCELKILQSTIVGVIVLHLLLVPGAAFITGGARIWEQDLHPHLTQLNQSLLTIGVLTLLLPAAFFAAIDGGVVTVAGAAASESVVNDSVRHTFLSMSRGLSVMLLAVYVCSRIFLHNPPGDGNALSQHPSAPQEVLHQELRLTTEDPEMNQWVCIAVLIVIVGIMASTAEWLVDSIEFVRKAGIQDEWFGLILLPIVSFSADGVVAITYFLRYTARDYFGTPSPPETLARARAIDLSIQFTLFWMPAVVLIGWWSNKPMSLLFDLFEVALLLGSCFLVNYVTADSKTNWLEGYAMVTFYLMIALCSWFYPGQTKIRDMVACTSVAAAVAGGVVEG